MGVNAKRASAADGKIEFPPGVASYEGTQRRSFLRLAAAAAIGASLRPRAAHARGQIKARVLVVGGGFAGATCALHLRRLDAAIEVTLIDPDARYTTCPMSNSVLTGSRDLASITVSRRGLERAGVRYVHDRVVAIDAHRQRARLSGGPMLAFDRLVMAPGIRFLWGTPQGYDEAAAQRMPHAWVAGAQTEILAAQLRGVRDGAVVAISVPHGPMRCPPGPFERASLIAGYLKRYKARCKVLIFDANNHFPRQDVFTEAWQSLYPGMIRWIPVVEDGVVTRVDPDRMILYTSQRTQHADVINIIPPQAPALLAVQAGLASDHGWCPVDPQTFESRLVRNVYVIGDACIADPMPKSGSAANAQGKHCAAALIAALDGRAAPQPPLESVCYSLLAPDMALSIHGLFRSAEGAIQQMPAPDTAAPASAAQEAQNAELWYKNIVADSFG